MSFVSRRPPKSWYENLDERLLHLLQSMIPIVDKSKGILMGQHYSKTVYAIGRFDPKEVNIGYLFEASEASQLSNLPLTKEQLTELEGIIRVSAGVSPERVYFREDKEKKWLDVVVVSPELSIPPPRKLIYINLLLEKE